MRFAAWLTQQEEIVIKTLPAGQQYMGFAQHPGQPNYVLELVAGLNTAAASVQGTLGPVTQSQLEALRDRLLQHFPPQQP